MSMRTHCANSELASRALATDTVNGVASGHIVGAALMLAWENSRATGSSRGPK